METIIESILSDIQEVKERKNIYLSFADFAALSKKDGFILLKNRLSTGIYDGVEIHGEPYIEAGKPFHGTQDEYLNYLREKRATYLSKLSWSERLFLFPF